MPEKTRSWMPTATAAGMALAMIWLAGGPLDMPEDEPPAGLVLLAPPDRVETFPRRFEWSPVEGATEYEVSVTERESGELVFRQRGASTALEVEIEGGGGPGRGDYGWEVRAFQAERVVSRAEGSFRVGRLTTPDGP